MDSNHRMEPCGLLPYRLGYVAPVPLDKIPSTFYVVLSIDVPMGLGRWCPHVTPFWAPSTVAPSLILQGNTGNTPANLSLGVAASQTLHQHPNLSLHTKGGPHPILRSLAGPIPTMPDDVP